MIRNGRRVRFGHVQRKNYFKFRVCRGLRAAPNAFSREGLQMPLAATTPLVKECSGNARRRFRNTNIKIKFR